MKILLFVVAGAVLLIAVLMFSNFGKDPSRKTTSMLRRERDLHNKRLMNIPPSSPKFSKAVEAMEVVEKELERREKEEAAQAHELEHKRPTPQELRRIAEDGYREAAAKAKARGKTDKQTHETALIGALLKHIQEEVNAPLVTEEMVAVLGMEILPFNVIPPDQGHKAIIEYIIWREYPEEANAEMVKGAVLAGIKTMRETGGTDFVDDLRKGPFAWNSLLN